MAQGDQGLRSFYLSTNFIKLAKVLSIQMKNNLIYSLIIFCLLTSGCASIISQNTKEIQIASQPSGAKISIKDNKTGAEIFVGSTPTIVHLKTGKPFFVSKSYSLTLSKEGYTDQQLEIRPRINGWYFGNILFGGLVGILIVDPLTGAMYTLAPKNINAVLVEKKVTLEHSLQVLTMKEIPEILKSELIPLPQPR